MARDDFSKEKTRTIAEIAAYMCSNPECLLLTSGPHSDKSKSLKNGVAAHILAASPGGPRYSYRQTKAERGSVENGIWLCHNCSDLVDKDPSRYTVKILQEWKRKHWIFVDRMRKIENTDVEIKKKRKKSNSKDKNDLFEKIYKKATGAQLRFLLILRESMKLGGKGLDCGYVSRYFLNVIQSKTDRYDGWITPFITAHLQENDLVSVSDNFFRLNKTGKDFLDYIESRKYPILSKEL